MIIRHEEIKMMVKKSDFNQGTTSGCFRGSWTIEYWEITRPLFSLNEHIKEDHCQPLSQYVIWCFSLGSSIWEFPTDVAEWLVLGININNWARNVNLTFTFSVPRTHFPQVTSLLKVMRCYHQNRAKCTLLPPSLTPHVHPLSSPLRRSESTITGDNGFTL